MTVNCTPFLTLFPLRFPAAKDIFCILFGLWLHGEGESASSAFGCPGRLRSRQKQADELGSDFQTPSSRTRAPLISATTASSATLSFECMVLRFVALSRLSSCSPRPLGINRSFATRKAASPAVRTKKKLSELPKARLLADGTFPVPLEPFDGGLGIKKSTRRRSSAPFRFDAYSHV